jgi:hypothetical protein
MKLPGLSTHSLPPSKTWILGAYAILACLGWWATYHACYPGLMTPDSITQLEQAQSLQFDDWHPPIMAGVWALALNFAKGPVSLFVPFITIYWGSLFLVAAALLRWSLWPSALAAVMGFSPVLINFAGTLWKDVLVFVCLMTVTGLLLVTHDGDSERRRPRYVYALCALFGLIGALARYNSMLAAIPLLMLLIYPKNLPERAFGALTRRLATALALTIGVVVATQASLNALVFHPEKTGVINALFLFDMVGVSAVSGKNVVPGHWTRKESQRIIEKCYAPEKWDGVTAGKCGFINDRIKQSGKWKAGLFNDWRAVVVSHPLAYLRHRANHILAFSWRPNLFFVGYAEQTAVDWGFAQNSAYKAMANLMAVPGPVLSVVYKPGLWMLFSIGMLAWTAIAAARRRPLAYPAFCLALSGFLYWTPLFLIGVANDFRYVYWTIGATLVSVLVMASGLTIKGVDTPQDSLPMREESIATTTGRGAI